MVVVLNVLTDMWSRFHHYIQHRSMTPDWKWHMLCTFFHSDLYSWSLNVCKVHVQCPSVHYSVHSGWGRDIGFVNEVRITVSTALSPIVHMAAFSWHGVFGIIVAFDRYHGHDNTTCSLVSFLMEGERPISCNMLHTMDIPSFVLN